MSSQLIVIDGLDGSGKTRLAHRLSELCVGRSIACTLVHLDDFKRPVDWSRVDDEVETYYRDYFDFSAVDRRLEALLAARPADSRQTQPPSMVVYDGIFTREVPATTHGTMVWLEVAEDEVRRRILVRDSRAKNRSPAEIERRISRRYFPAHRRYRVDHRPHEAADWIVDNRDYRRPLILRSGRGRLHPEHRAILQEALDDDRS